MDKEQKHAAELRRDEQVEQVMRSYENTCTQIEGLLADAPLDTAAIILFTTYYKLKIRYDVRDALVREERQIRQKTTD